MTQFTERQYRELVYHQQHAAEHEHLLDSPLAWDVIRSSQRRWWNAYWEMFAYLRKHDLRERRVLVVGCGFGDDALRLAKLGAQVSAFDLSPDCLRIAKKLAVREGLAVHFDEMAVEQLTYPDSSFDYIVARDILHHVDIPSAMEEICRVAKPNSLFVANEVYSHSLTDIVRRSVLVERVLYPRMQGFVYDSQKPYITEDERKISEKDLRVITSYLGRASLFRHFNFLVNRIIPDKYEMVTKLDQILLGVLEPAGLLLAGRILFAAPVKK